MKSPYIIADPLSGLGRIQREILARLLDGWYIRVVRDHRDITETIALSDGDNEQYCQRTAFIGLCDRGLLVDREAVGCLDIDVHHYHLKKEYREPVIKLLKTKKI